MDLKFLSVGCGDGIVIRFLGNDDRYHNIIIDGGTEKGKVYENTLRQEIRQIIDRKEIIDLWVISHIDDDHIGGLLKFINDTELIEESNLKETVFWYNSYEFDYEISSKDTVLLSEKQSSRLKDYLTENSNAVSNTIFAGKRVDFYGLEMTILSPIESFFEVVDKSDDTTILLGGKLEADWDKKVENFDLAQFEEDSKKEHRHCIALLLNYSNKRFLLSSDSYPSVLIESLMKLGYDTKTKLDLEILQLSHHGSKFNTSLEFLQIINCKKFVISADGYNKYNLPNKETIARVLNTSEYPVEVHITHKNDITESLFKVDDDTIKNKVSLLFPECFSNFLSFRI